MQVNVEQKDYKVVASLLSRHLAFSSPLDVIPFAQYLLTGVIEETGEEALPHFRDVMQMLSSKIGAAASANINDSQNESDDNNQQWRYYDW